MSADQRKDLATFARAQRTRKQNGQPLESEIVAALVAKLRQSDVDLAKFVDLFRRMPFRYQERLSLILTDQEREAMAKALELVHCSLAPKPLTPSYFEREPLEATQ
jgi:hypothetical protein